MTTAPPAPLRAVTYERYSTDMQNEASNSARRCRRGAGSAMSSSGGLTKSGGVALDAGDERLRKPGARPPARAAGNADCTSSYLRVRPQGMEAREARGRLPAARRRRRASLTARALRTGSGNRHGRRGGPLPGGERSKAVSKKCLAQLVRYGPKLGAAGAGGTCPTRRLLFGHSTSLRNRYWVFRRKGTLRDTAD